MSNEPEMNESPVSPDTDPAPSETTPSQESSEETGAAAAPATESVVKETDEAEVENPLKPVHVRNLAMVALGLITLGLLPGIYADYQTSRILLAPRPANLKKHRKIKRHVTRTRRITPVYFQGHTRRHNGLKKAPVLYGRLYRSMRPNKRLLIYVHDQKRNFRQGVPFAEAMVKRGFDVFLYDRQGHGASDGKIALQPGDESKDLGQAYRYLWRLYPRRWKRHVGILGEGTAGDIVLFGANRHRNFRAIVSIRPTLDLEVALKKRLQRRKLPAFLTSLIVTRVSRVAHFRYKWNAPLRRARYLRRTPTMLIRDEFSNGKDHQKFCRLKKGVCARVRLSRGALESFSWRKFETSQQQRVLHFLERHLKLKKTRFGSVRKKKVIPRKKFRLPRRPRARKRKRKVVAPPPRRRPTRVRKPARVRKTKLKKSSRRTKPTVRRRVPVRNAPPAGKTRKRPVKKAKNPPPTTRKAAARRPLLRNRPLLRLRIVGRPNQGSRGAFKGVPVPRPPVLRLKQPSLVAIPTPSTKRARPAKRKPRARPTSRPAQKRPAQKRPPGSR